MAADELQEAQVSPAWREVFQHKVTEQSAPPAPPGPPSGDEPGEANVSQAWTMAFRHRPDIVQSSPAVPVRPPDEPGEANVSQTWRQTWKPRIDVEYPQSDVSPPGNVIIIADAGASVDALLASVITEFPAEAEVAGAIDGINVFKYPVPPQSPLMITPGPATLPGPHTGPASGKLQPGTPVAAPALPAASPAFIRSYMPRMHVENLLTHQWYTRDVQNVTSPLITWMLNGADTFTCTIDPPRADLLDSNGEPLFNEWQAACYLEESDEIKFGGILTASTMQGPSWNQTWTGFAGYPNGIPYEGAAYSQVNIDALDVVRYIWDWIQRQDQMRLGMILDSTKSGVLLGAQLTASQLQTTISGKTVRGQQFLLVNRLSAGTGQFRKGMHVLIGSGGAQESNIIQLVSPPGTVAAGFTGIVLAKPLALAHNDAAPFGQAPVPIPITLDWWNSTDLGQEITSIQQEAVFDYREQHLWSDKEKRQVTHHLRFGVPRIGTRRLDLRFVEGENLTVASQISRDGSTFASAVVGMGAGQGITTIRSEVTDNSTGRLRRVQVYQDQTVKHQLRMSVKARRVLQSLLNIDTVSQVTVKNTSHAPFGTFGPGDDILIQLASGWRNASIWSRILQMQQDPTTDTMNLTLARSDSFTYMAASGQAGTL